MFASADHLRWREGDLFLGRSTSGRDAGLATERGAICIAGSRAGKGTSIIIPNLKRWPHSTLVIDPKGENATATWEAREAFGPVHVLDPFLIADVPDRLRAACNPLDGISASSLTGREDIRVIADGLVMRTNDKDAVWDDGAVTVIAGLIAHAVAKDPGTANLPAMRQLLKSSPLELDALFGEMAADGEAFGGLARAAASVGLDDTRSSAEFVSGAARNTDWLDSPAMIAPLSQSSFSLSELKTANASVFLVLPPAYLGEHGRFLRLFVLAALSEMTKHGLNSRPCLFILDEFFSLGQLGMLQKAAGLLPGYGVRLFPFLQDIGQLHQLYRRDGAETFLANSDAQIFFGNSDMATLNYISNRLGTITDDELGAEPPRLKAFRRSQQRFFENLRELENRIEIENQMARDWHQYKMARIGRPRLAPDDIQLRIGKRPGDKVAHSMIVFGPLGRVYNLRLAPYFLPAPEVEPQRKEVVARRSLVEGGFRAIAALILLAFIAAHSSWGSAVVQYAIARLMEGKHAFEMVDRAPPFPEKGAHRDEYYWSDEPYDRFEQ